ncbi:transporter [Bradyrhizobium sp. U87765 SZCCT0131]|uniref:AmiS/UreI family transporter n=1 Tax=unclassified Bradyrhizobium TaxID=2631580 RepID=UPI001BA93BDA|nr:MULTISPECIES: AmiS/UreI family transporter [unclassified Bradyrhizobium]MBR1220698.1 transporter [Bradyrhizobium sp. U87765 SZCCT0131]MBR1265879.1 transporter [Bradyrhizobium sp. U87765 SZCCT0134]MBR1307270.1 transporter [Bradyrhizobium sp. U87765 SZCCT0110]MBR1324143.1 transporter [Bradyrhizobium sp. U87765 SZCCT0109]MBR1346224.1 transporter [Bradyrhizobium sp. U87765 SZCCT0048]
MLVGLVLLYVGIVLFQNGLWLHGRISDREVALPNFFSGGVLAIVSLVLIAVPGVALEAVKAAALILLFGLTFLWVALNQFNGNDGRGLGWYCAVVAVILLPVAAENLHSAVTLWNYWFALCWILWAILYVMFFLLLVRGAKIGRQTGWMALLNSVVTGLAPGYLLLGGHMA